MVGLRDAERSQLASGRPTARGIHLTGGDHKTACSARSAAGRSEPAVGAGTDDRPGGPPRAGRTPVFGRPGPRPRPGAGGLRSGRTERRGLPILSDPYAARVRARSGPPRAPALFWGFGAGVPPCPGRGSRVAGGDDPSAVGSVEEGKIGVVAHGTLRVTLQRQARISYHGVISRRP